MQLLHFALTAVPLCITAAAAHFSAAAVNALLAGDYL